MEARALTRARAHALTTRLSIGLESGVCHLCLAIVAESRLQLRLADLARARLPDLN
jgi:hypothetical protein